MASPLILPITTIQPDFLTVASDIRDALRTGITSEDVWISCYKSNEPSIHGKVNISKPYDSSEAAEVGSSAEVGLEWTARDGVEFKRDHDGGTAYSIACPALNIPPTPIRVPRQTFSSTPENSESRNPRKITAFAIAPDVSQFAIGHADGSVYIHPLSPPTTPHPNPIRTKPHLSTLTSLRFFPSSRVLLTASLDFTLTILPTPSALDPASPAPPTALTLTPARTLKAHTRSITDTAIISAGRNVLSASKDGTVRLWDIPSGAPISTFTAHRFSAVNKLALAVNVDVESTPLRFGAGGREAAVVDEREVETQDKIVFCALQDGSVEILDLRIKLSAARIPPPTFSSSSSTAKAGALTAIAHEPTHSLLATGSQNGLICLYDVRNIAHHSTPESESESSPLLSFMRNTSCIEDLSFTHLPHPEPSTSVVPSLLIAAEDGLPYVASLDTSRDGEGGKFVVGVGAELVGSDCEAVRVVRVDGQGGWWTAGDDGVVRFY